MRRFRLYRMLRAAWVIATVALGYWWLQKRRSSTPQAWARAHAKTGRKILGLATGLNGAFVKLGQILGSRADVLPEPLVAPLRQLHDRVPARPLAKLRRHAERELGRPLGEVFAEIDEQPIAAASLAQVHRARLANGDDVVVKIQYPEARRLFPIDLGSLRMAARVARWVNRGLDLRPLVDELAEFVCLELDFAREARSTERVRANLANDPTVVVPRVHAELSTDRLLVLELLDGTPLTRLDALRERGVDLRDVAQRVARLYATLIFDHGFFHGDPHPGNLFVLADGKRLALLDFGLAKELPPGFAASAAAMMAGAMRGDLPGALAAARAIGFVVADERAPQLLGLVRALLGDYRDTGRLAQELRRGKRGELEIPSHFTLIARVMVILSGVSHTLVPGERVIGGALLAALAPHLAALREPPTEPVTQVM
ncbi:MAG: AarF/ABC1/UbiB kinase family protein [Deltaproteobacteria bacterium]|nr:AarF/ABC1/UbiB kinase family protein [Deltaproteobacteria bacterium]